jgi:hypothetical protein
MLLASRRFPYYRSLTPALKAFSVVAVVVPSTVIYAERAGLEFEKDRWYVPSVNAAAQRLTATSLGPALARMN